MPLDGIFLHHVCGELQRCCGCRADKISQPSRDELVIALRSPGFSAKLLLSARPGSARLHFTKASFENPAVPPMFCMLMRKHLSGARILSVTQDGAERALTFTLLAADEMGDLRELRLVCELIGNQSNIILVGADGRIIDAVRRSDIESGGRLIQPGAVYAPPEGLGKIPLTDEGVLEAVLSHGTLPLSRAVLETVDGISPLIARELAHRVSSGFEDDPTVDLLTDAEKRTLSVEIDRMRDALSSPQPCILYDGQGMPKDFSYTEITQYGADFSYRPQLDFSTLLDTFYSEKDRTQRLRHSAADVFKTLSNLSARTEKKLYLRKEEQKKCADREKFRIYGELIKANIGLIERGAEFADVPNYYDENLATVRIPLLPELSPAANSARYFKEYRKLCSAEQTLGTLIADCEREREYIASVQDALSRAETLSEILDIKDELIRAGYIRVQKQRTAKRQSLSPREYTSSDGYRMLVGRNNSQNDELTLRTARKGDLWFHTKNIHGSHVIVLCDGEEPPECTLLEAAALAAYHSQARASSQVPVDYTRVKNVKKPSGARPGMVIYTHNNTIYTTPKEP